MKGVTTISSFVYFLFFFLLFFVITELVDAAAKPSTLGGDAAAIDNGLADKLVPFGLHFALPQLDSCEEEDER